jgi:putative inorganic carbon (HCO3(-)) transporter
MELAVGMIADSPVLGVGANNFAPSIDPYVTVDYSRSWISTVHNKYLLVWAETGIVGLAAFLWMLLASLRLAWRGAVAGKPSLSPVAAGLLVGVVANMVHMLVSIFHGRSQVHMLLLVIGLSVAVWNVLDSEREGVAAQLGV